MPEIPLGFSFDPTDDGFVLRTKTDDGIVTEIKVPAEHVHALKTEIDLWSDRRLSALRVASGAVTNCSSLGWKGWGVARCCWGKRSADGPGSLWWQCEFIDPFEPG